MYEMSLGEDDLMCKVRCWSNIVPGAPAGEKPDSRPPPAAGELAARSQNSHRNPKSGRGVELLRGGPARERGTTVRAATAPVNPSWLRQQAWASASQGRYSFRPTL